MTESCCSGSSTGGDTTSCFDKSFFEVLSPLPEEFVSGDDDSILAPSLPNMNDQIFYTRTDGKLARRITRVTTQCEYLVDGMLSNPTMDCYEDHPPPPLPVKRKNITPNNPAHKRRKKNIWSADELNALIDGINLHGLNWSDIKNDEKFCILNCRSNVDLKDKWRNIITTDFKQNFSTSILNNLRGPTHWNSIALSITNYVNKYCQRNLNDITWNETPPSDPELNKISALGKIKILTIYRCMNTSR